MAKQQILIRVGHPAYKGANRMRYCFSKAQAIRVLRHRGATRNAARDAVNKAMRDMGATIYGGETGWEVVEISNEIPSLRAGHFCKTYEELRANWAPAPEL